jgi:hypothetical protein
MNCPNCGTYNPDEREVCWRCDKPLPKPATKKKRDPQKSAQNGFIGSRGVSGNHRVANVWVQGAACHIYPAAIPARRIRHPNRRYLFARVYWEG